MNLMEILEIYEVKRLRVYIDVLGKHKSTMSA